jgi:hypothetical protein
MAPLPGPVSTVGARRSERVPRSLLSYPLSFERLNLRMSYRITDTCKSTTSGWIYSEKSLGTALKEAGT